MFVKYFPIDKSGSMSIIVSNEEYYKKSSLDQVFHNGNAIYISPANLSLITGNEDADTLRKILTNRSIYEIVRDISTNEIPTVSYNKSTTKIIDVIKDCIKYNIITTGTNICIESPETNMHPESQRVCADDLINLMIDNKVNFYITSDSLVFIRAIECYMDKYEEMNSLYVYRVMEEDSDIDIDMVDVTYSEYGMSILYDELSEPFDLLEEMLKEKYGDDY